MREGGSKLEVSIRYLPLELKEPTEEAGRLYESEGTEDTRRTQPMKLTKQGSHGLTEFKAASTSVHGSSPGPLYICSGYFFSVLWVS